MEGTDGSLVNPGGAEPQPGLAPELGTEVGLSQKARPWDPWATVGWSLLILLAWSLVQAGVTVFVVFGLATNSQAELAAILISLPVIAGLPWLLAQVRCPPAGDYLAYRSATTRQTVLAVAGLLLFEVVSDSLTVAIGRPLVSQFSVDFYRSGPISLVLIAVLICAPVGEETFFRGFLYRGLAESRLGPGMAIGLTAVAFAMLHLQYDLYEMATIYLIGLYIGTFRYLTGSVRLAILLHLLHNLIATGEALLLGGQGP